MVSFPEIRENSGNFSGSRNRSRAAGTRRVWARKMLCAWAPEVGNGLWIESGVPDSLLTSQIDDFLQIPRNFLKKSSFLPTWKYSGIRGIRFNLRSVGEFPEFPEFLVQQVGFRWSDIKKSRIFLEHIPNANRSPILSSIGHRSAKWQPISRASTNLMV